MEYLLYFIYLLYGILLTLNCDYLQASKKPSYDDDFDSEVDEDSEEEEQQKKAEPPPSTTSASAAQQSKSGKSNNNKKSKGGGADSSDDSDDFSDPDDMQIPGGGLSLGTATGTREKSKGMDRMQISITNTSVEVVKIYS